MAMPDFSTIIQDPTIRQIVQENILERAFHDALFPRLLYRGEATPQLWPANVGDSMVFTGVGLIKPKMAPLAPGLDPTPSSYQSEQWPATIQQYADTIDTHMPTSIVAIANLFLRNAHQLGMSAGQALNRLVRDRLYNAAVSGNTVTTVAQGGGGSASMHVQRLNGFTKARRPDLPTGSPVRFDTVSATNPLAITIGGSAASVVGFTPDIAGDEVGPGVLTLAVATTWAARVAVLASDASFLQRVGGGATIDALTAANIMTLADIRSVVARFWQQNVPEQPDGRFHCHLSPSAQSEIFADAEFQRLLTALPDYYMYKQFALGELLGVVFFRNSEAPIAQTVEGGPTAVYSSSDPLALELYTTGIATGIPVQHTLFVGQGLIHEYYQELSQLITEAGVTGRVGEPRITNNSIEVFSERIQLILRAPLNRLQDLVSTSWKFIGDWPARTDVTTGDGARYKRATVIQHA
jgi:hypothetical protein